MLAEPLSRRLLFGGNWWRNDGIIAIHICFFFYYVTLLFTKSVVHLYLPLGDFLSIKRPLIRPVNRDLSYPD